ncbi:hypothetical protein HPP92_003539 [Vanilla planifolia]|uniref:Uncharacterized protein n=1 Tax=Vanilla planifolia TaxID=51239 RepID=A0A835VJ02_VANPL|nr:hypothetical protein HPP92_003539 [Vanilla planifolia]
MRDNKKEKGRSSNGIKQVPSYPRLQREEAAAVTATKELASEVAAAEEEEEE